MVDARGYLCPMPVVMVQEAIKKGQPAALDVLVDNETAVENIKRFAPEVIAEKYNSVYKEIAQS